MDFTELAVEMVNNLGEATNTDDPATVAFRSVSVIINALTTAYQQGFVEGFTSAVKEEQS